MYVKPRDVLVVAAILNPLLWAALAVAAGLTVLWWGWCWLREELAARPRPTPWEVAGQFVSTPPRNLTNPRENDGSPPFGVVLPKPLVMRQLPRFEAVAPASAAQTRSDGAARSPAKKQAKNTQKTVRKSGKPVAGGGKIARPTKSAPARRKASPA